MSQLSRTVIDLDGNDVAMGLAGEQDAHLKILEQRLDCKLTLRGNVLILEGEVDSVEQARAAIDELLTVIRDGRPLDPAIVESLMDSPSTRRASRPRSTATSSGRTAAVRSARAP